MPKRQRVFSSAAERGLTASPSNRERASARAGRLRRGALCVAVGAALVGLGPAVGAQTASELKAQIEALQRSIAELEKKQASAPGNAVTGGDVPGSFKLPGTDTSLSIYGFVKGDVIFSNPSAGGQNSISDQFLNPGGIPVGPTAGANEKNQLTLHARQTRLGVRSSTPSTRWGPVTTVLEVDFFGPTLGGGPALANSAGDELVSGRTAPALRLAYGTIGKLGVGQFWTAFENQAAIPDTLDFGGPVGNIFVRQTQVRWTQPFSRGNWEISLESPESAIASGGVLLRPDDDRYPDIVGRVNLLKTPNGDFWGSILARNIRIDQPGTVDNKWGAAIQLGAIIPFKTSVGTDDFKIAVNYGNVIGRYQELGFFPDGVLVNNQLELLDVVSGFASYRHFWSPQLRSSLVLSASSADYPSGAAGTLNKAARSAHVNLIWTPFPSVDLGIEYIYGRREIQNGQDGDLNRLQFSAKYAF